MCSATVGKDGAGTTRMTVEASWRVEEGGLRWELSEGAFLGRREDRGRAIREAIKNHWAHFDLGFVLDS